MNKRHRAAILLADMHALKIDPPPQLDERIAQMLQGVDYYGDQIERLARSRYDGKINDAQFIAGMGFLITSQLRRAMRDALRDLDERGVDIELENELTRVQMDEQSHVRDLLLAILLALSQGKSFETLLARLQLWKYRYLDTYNRALIIIGKRKHRLLVWRFGATEKHCTDCAHYEGQVKTADEWQDIYRVFGHRPQSPFLECGGWRCDCRLEVTR